MQEKKGVSLKKNQPGIGVDSPSAPADQVVPCMARLFVKTSQIHKKTPKNITLV